jgi:hypothetical protein
MCLYFVSVPRCARCKKEPYCSRECQTEGWKAHKPNCIPFGKLCTSVRKFMTCSCAQSLSFHLFFVQRPWPLKPSPRATVSPFPKRAKRSLYTTRVNSGLTMHPGRSSIPVLIGVPPLISRLVSAKSLLAGTKGTFSSCLVCPNSFLSDLTVFLFYQRNANERGAKGLDQDTQ